MRKTSVQIAVTKDAYTSDQVVGFSSYVLGKFKLSFEGLKIKHKDLQEVQKRIKEVDPLINLTKFPITIFYDYYVMESEENMLVFDTFENKKKIQINYYFNNYKKAKVIFDIIQSFEDKDDDLFINISNFYLTPNKDIKTNDLLKVKDDFKDNFNSYYPYLNTEEMFKQYLLSDSNILVLSGKTGSGKTRLADSLMEYMLDVNDLEQKTKPKLKTKKFSSSESELDQYVDNLFNGSNIEEEGVKVAYIKNEEILSMDGFWNMLQEEEYDLIFLDDLDFSLLPRTQNISTSEDIQKNKFISNLLSFTDGIFNAGNKTKFVITSNRDVNEIDTAILRKGRTFDILNLRELTSSEALNIWLKNDLPEAEFHKEFMNKTVLQADLGSSIGLKVKAKEQDIVLKDYISEAGISVYNKIKQPKKIGL